MNTAVMFSSASDEWATPQALFDELNQEFQFDIDLAASNENSKCEEFYSKESDALEHDWATAGEHIKRGFLNPPYSRGLQGKFIEKAARQRRRGFLAVMLLPARTDTKAFHAHIWNIETQRPREGVEVRFLPGRLKFGGAKHGAPFPSMVVVFRPA